MTDNAGKTEFVNTERKERKKKKRKLLFFAIQSYSMLLRLQ